MCSCLAATNMFAGRKLLIGVVEAEMSRKPISCRESNFLASAKTHKRGNVVAETFTNFTVPLNVSLSAPTHNRLLRKQNVFEKHENVLIFCFHMRTQTEKNLRNKKFPRLRLHATVYCGSKYICEKREMFYFLLLPHSRANGKHFEKQFPCLRKP